MNKLLDAFWDIIKFVIIAWFVISVIKYYSPPKQGCDEVRCDFVQEDYYR